MYRHVFISSKFNLTGGCTVQMYISSKLNVSTAVGDWHYARFQDIACMSKLFLFCKLRIYNRDQLKIILARLYQHTDEIGQKSRKLRIYNEKLVCTCTCSCRQRSVLLHLWKIHGSFYGEIRLFVLLVSLINHVFI